MTGDHLATMEWDLLAKVGEEEFRIGTRCEF